MPEVHEIAPDVYRISVYGREINLAFNHFLVRDEEPLLFHAGLRQMFPLVREAVATLIDPAKLRHIGFSRFEFRWVWRAERVAAYCAGRRAGLRTGGSVGERE